MIDKDTRNNLREYFFEHKEEVIGNYYTTIGRIIRSNNYQEDHIRYDIEKEFGFSIKTKIKEYTVNDNVIKINLLFEHSDFFNYTHEEEFIYLKIILDNEYELLQKTNIVEIKNTFREFISDFNKNINNMKYKDFKECIITKLNNTQLVEKNNIFSLKFSEVKDCDNAIRVIINENMLRFMIYGSEKGYYHQVGL